MDDFEPETAGAPAVHEPVEHVKIWAGEKIRLLARTPAGEPVELDWAEVETLRSLLFRLEETKSDEAPYEPEDTPFGALIHEICVGLGFCGCVKDGEPRHVTRFIPSSGPVTADQFVEWVFLADDLNPNVEFQRSSALKQSIRDAFVRHMGGEEVDASDLHWGRSKSEPEPDVKVRGRLELDD